jgi:hypothetical protein
LKPVSPGPSEYVRLAAGGETVLVTFFGISHWFPAGFSNARFGIGSTRISSKFAWRMSAAIARILPRASAASVAATDTLVQVALFSGVGLVLWLTVLILDQNIPAEWF